MNYDSKPTVTQGGADAHTFPEGEIVLNVAAHDAGVYVATTRGVYRVEGDVLRPLRVSAEAAPVLDSWQSLTVENLGYLIEEAFKIQNVVPSVDWAAAANYIVSIVKFGPVDEITAGSPEGEAHVEPGSVTFDPHENSRLMQDDAFRQALGEMRSKNGLA